MKCYSIETALDSYSTSFVNFFPPSHYSSSWKKWDVSFPDFSAPRDRHLTILAKRYEGAMCEIFFSSLIRRREQISLFWLSSYPLSALKVNMYKGDAWSFSSHPVTLREKLKDFTSMPTQQSDIIEIRTNLWMAYLQISERVNHK